MYFSFFLWYLLMPCFVMQTVIQACSQKPGRGLGLLLYLFNIAAAHAGCWGAWGAHASSLLHSLERHRQVCKEQLSWIRGCIFWPPAWCPRAVCILLCLSMATRAQDGLCGYCTDWLCQLRGVHFGIHDPQILLFPVPGRRVSVFRLQLGNLDTSHTLKNKTKQKNLIQQLRCLRL